MKYIKIAWITAILLVFMTACGKKDESSASSVESGSSLPQSTSQLNASSAPESSSNQPVSGSASSITESTASSSTAEAIPQAVLLEGLFISSDTVRYTRERASRFELFTDGTFIFHLNLGDKAIGTEKGTYTASGGTLVLTVLERELDDYLGENLESHTFTMLDNDHFVYNGDPLGMTRDQDKFTRDGFTQIFARIHLEEAQRAELGFLHYQSLPAQFRHLEVAPRVKPVLECV